MVIIEANIEYVTGIVVVGQKRFICFWKSQRKGKAYFEQVFVHKFDCYTTHRSAHHALAGKDSQGDQRKILIIKSQANTVCTRII